MQKIGRAYESSSKDIPRYPAAAAVRQPDLLIAAPECMGVLQSLTFLPRECDRRCGNLRIAKVRSFRDLQ